MEHAIDTGNHGNHIGGIADADDDDVAMGGHVGRAGAGGGAGAGQLVHAAGGTIPHVEGIARFEQVVGHATSHDAQPNISDCWLCHCLFLNI